MCEININKAIFYLYLKYLLIYSRRKVGAASGDAERNAEANQRCSKGACRTWAEVGGAKDDGGGEAKDEGQHEKEDG